MMVTTVDAYEIQFGRRLGRCVCCPVCGDTLVHPAAAMVNPGGSVGGSVVVLDDGVSINKTADPDGPGVHVCLSFACGYGHHFVIHFAFGADGRTRTALRHLDIDGVAPPIWKAADQAGDQANEPMGADDGD